MPYNFPEKTLDNGHYDAFDACCKSKISKNVISRPIYHYLSSHRRSCSQDNVSNDALEGSNGCWVMVFSETMVILMHLTRAVGHN